MPIDFAGGFDLMRNYPAGHLDVFSYAPEDRTLSVAGWLLFPDGAPRSLALVVPGRDRVPVAVRARTDVAKVYPWIPRGERCGFAFDIQGLSLTPGEVLEFVLEVSRENEEVVLFPIGYREPDSGVPRPSPEFVRRVARSNSVDYFISSGIRHACDIVRLLRPHRNLNEAKSFLDWGCGSGRVTRHLQGMLPNSKVHGTDIDHEAIAWLTSIDSSGSYSVCPKEPPFPSIRSDTFDMILASSVFTHLREGLQRRWLEELYRVLAPRGILLATTHGRYAAAWVHAEPIDRALDESGFFDGYGDEALGDIASQDYYRSTFQTAEHVRATWMNRFCELELIEGGLNFHQDVWILEAMK